MPIDSPFLFKQIIETCHTTDNLSKAIGDYNDKDSLWLYENVNDNETKQWSCRL